MAPIPQYAKVQDECSTALAQAFIMISKTGASLAALQTALAIIDRDGDPSDPVTRMHYLDAHRRIGRALGHKPAPAKWEAP